MTRLEPIEDKVVLRVIENKELEVLNGGILAPVSAKKPTIEAEVIAIGQGRYASETGVFIPTILARNDIVLIANGSGLPTSMVTENGREDVLIMREGDILMRLGKKEGNS